ncbi:hypothetical protein SLS58_003265 [Diplodia intermedia]|uniref:RNase H type-1 domain-containing protein n=1 Tax=Diplodia intermedia TaxID=856260 RepID=A0ABR3TWG1_9PEZI
MAIEKKLRAAAASGVALSPLDPARFLLFSDCEGVLRALKTLRRGCLLPLSYPPSHRGITGNELADAVAKENRPDVLDPARGEIGEE